MLELEINWIDQDFRKHAHIRREIVKELQVLPNMMTCKVQTGVLTLEGMLGNLLSFKKN